MQSSGMAALGALSTSVSHIAGAASSAAPFQWNADNLVFSFDVINGKLRQKRLMPATEHLSGNSSGVEVAVQCSGENSPDQGMKSAMGQPGARLLFAEKHEESTPRGKRLLCTHTDSQLGLSLQSVYESFDGVPVVRRYTQVTNHGTSPVGIEFLSSAMLHGLADPQNYDHELRIHVAFNSWMAEGQ